MRHSVAMPVIVVREFIEDDRSAVIGLWESCDLLRPWNDAHLDINRNLAAPSARLFVAVTGSEVIGSVMAGYDGHRGWVNYLAVDPDQRGTGVGECLMGEATSYFNDVGCPKINLQIRAHNTGAIAFYEGLGFTVDDVVSMGKRLVDDAPPDR